MQDKEKLLVKDKLLSQLTLCRAHFRVRPTMGHLSTSFPHADGG